MSKTRINDPKMHALRVAVSDQLEKIQRIVGSDYRLTLIARHKTNADAHIMLSENDERAAIEAAAELLRDSEA